MLKCAQNGFRHTACWLSATFFKVQLKCHLFQEVPLDFLTPTKSQMSSCITKSPSQNGKLLTYWLYLSAANGRQPHSTYQLNYLLPGFLNNNTIKVSTQAHMPWALSPRWTVLSSWPAPSWVILTMILHGSCVSSPVLQIGNPRRGG